MKRQIRFIGLVVGALILMISLVSPAAVPVMAKDRGGGDSPANAPACTDKSMFKFNGTNKTVCGKFLDYFWKHGAFAQQGFPISEQFDEISDVNGYQYTVQYFERAVFEHHTEYAGTPSEVLLTLLGRFELNRRYPGGLAPAKDAEPVQGATYFDATHHNVAGRFLKYWNENGGLAQQGYPLTEEFQEVSALNGQTYLVQYFERAVFEYHPEYAGSTAEVLLSQLGKFRLDLRYPKASGTANYLNLSMFQSFGLAH